MKAVIYARVSTNEQETERQVNELIIYAKQLNLEVVETFAEKISGTISHKQRPAFSALLIYIQENGIKNVLTHELSRIGRNLRDTLTVLEYFNKNGVCVYTKSELIRTLNSDGKENPDATFRVNIFGSIAKLEIDTLKTRVISGLRNSKLNGGANSAVQPYGFQSVSKKLAIQPEEVKIVKEIYSRYLKGYSMVKIAQHLNDLGVPTRKNRRWVDKTVNDILTNPLYKGERYHTGERVPYNLEIIIPFENWGAVQELIKRKAIYHNRDSKNINLLKGLIYCGNCGEPLYMHRRKDLSDNAYKCLTTKTGYKAKPCGLKGVNVDLLNLMMFVFIASSDDSIINKMRNKAENHNEVIHEKIKNLESNLIKLNKEQFRLTTAYIKELIKEPIFIEQSKDYDNEIEKINKRILNFKEQLVVVPEPQKLNKSNISGENLIGEFQKVITRIEVSNVPLESTKFSRRGDNIAYKIFTQTINFNKKGAGYTNYISSRDKRIFDVNWKFTGLSLAKAKKIEI